MNSRGVASGTRELTRDSTGKFKTRRIHLPTFVSARLRSLYEASGLSKGAPDLIIWNTGDSSVRFVEVKCPHWDRPSEEQLRFLRVAEAAGVTILRIVALREQPVAGRSWTPRASTHRGRARPNHQAGALLRASWRRPSMRHLFAHSFEGTGRRLPRHTVWRAPTCCI